MTPSPTPAAKPAEPTPPKPADESPWEPQFAHPTPALDRLLGFRSVHPLYGAADIRASTHHRNEAVRHDALARLGRARAALAAIHQALPLTILDELGLRVRKRIEQYERVWNTGDETAADRFLTPSSR